MTMTQTLNKITSKWLGFLILSILFLFHNYNSGTLFFSEENDIPLINQQILEREFKGMVSWKEPDWEYGLYTVFGEEENPLGYFFLSEDNRWRYSGYAGPVPVMVKLDNTWRISEVIMLENRETPRFLLKLYNRHFLKSWKGMTLEEAADSQVDTISGVTLTSRAIIANISEFLEGSEGRSQMGRLDWRSITLRIFEALVLLSALMQFFSRRWRKLRTVQLGLDVLVFGFLAGDFISLAMLGGFLTGAVPFLANPLLWIMFLLSILLPAVSDKSFYCAHVCPYGAAQELAGYITSYKRRLPRQMKNVTRILRPVFFGILSLLIILDYKIDLSLTEPFAAFLYSVAAPLTLIFACLFLVLSLFYARPWCRWLCPTGQLLEYFRSDK